MGRESSILITRPKVSDIWVTGAFGGNSSVETKRARLQWTENWTEESLAVEGKREGARKKGEVKVRLTWKGQEYFRFKC